MYKQILNENELNRSVADRIARRINLLQIKRNKDESNSRIINEFNNVLQKLTRLNIDQALNNDLIEARKDYCDNELHQRTWSKFYNPIYSGDVSYSDKNFDNVVKNNVPISIAWFGGGTEQRAGVEEMKLFFEKQYPGCFKFFDHLVYEHNGGSGWGNEEYEKEISKADIVIIHTAIRTNYDREVRSLAKCHMSLGK